MVSGTRAIIIFLLIALLKNSFSKLTPHLSIGIIQLHAWASDSGVFKTELQREYDVYVPGIIRIAEWLILGAFFFI